MLSNILLLGAVAAIVKAQDSCTKCDDVHFFLARGNNEPYPGRQAALVDATCDGLSGCGYEDLLYSALYTDLYCQDVYEGSLAGHAQMAAYVQQCPDTKTLIVAGYSQGAQVMSDILGGGGGPSFNGCLQPDHDPLDSSIGDKISAVILFSDVRHTKDQSYNYGNGSSVDGYFPRTGEMLTQLDKYASIMRSYCVIDDPICAANQSVSSEASHLDYYNLYAEEAATWIRSVASLSQTTSFTTAIPTSVSGTVQDYATMDPSTTPTGTVTSWTSIQTPCYAETVASTTSEMTTSSTASLSDTSAATFAGVSVTASETDAAAASSVAASSSMASTSASATPSSGGNMLGVQCGTILLLTAFIMIVFV